MSSTIYRHARASRNDLPAFFGPGVATPTDAEVDARLASLRRTLRIQTVFTALFFVAFLLYLPIGMAVIDDFHHLTIQEVRRRQRKQLIMCLCVHVHLTIVC